MLRVSRSSRFPTPLSISKKYSLSSFALFFRFKPTHSSPERATITKTVEETLTLLGFLFPPSHDLKILDALGNPRNTRKPRILGRVDGNHISASTIVAIVVPLALRISAQSPSRKGFTGERVWIKVVFLRDVRTRKLSSSSSSSSISPWRRLIIPANSSCSASPATPSYYFYWRSTTTTSSASASASAAPAPTPPPPPPSSPPPRHHHHLLYPLQQQITGQMAVLLMI
uniref:Uncharacterized protein n=1 Tax=Ananas comosus var. bracteatus TaxID=296719 RepID=A0A6V7Q4U6_ANACO|nr:unnamed protein product [Ananas comosus var. bracteatus]